VLNVRYIFVNRDSLHLEGPVCDYELWDILTAGRLTGSFVRMTRNGKVKKEMCCVDSAAWS